MIHNEAMFNQAVELIQRWQVCSRTNFQRHMRVGFLTRDRLLFELEDYGYIVFAERDRDRFIVSELCWHEDCSLPIRHAGNHYRRAKKEGR